MAECRICNNQQHLATIEAKEMFIGTREPFSYVLCQNCGSLSLASSISNLEELYAKYPVFDFAPIKVRRLKHFMRRYVLLNQNLIARIFLHFLSSWEDLAFKSLYGIKLHRSMRILDVGCSNGMFIKTLKSFGFQDLMGIDPYLKYPQEEPGLRLLKMNINDLDEQFDLVMCHHSFEHFEDVQACAERLIALTKPGGWLIIRMPNIESYSFLKYQKHWHGIHAPFHTVLPSRKGMDEIFQKTCMDLIERRQEQITELFLYNMNCAMDIALLESLGVINFLGNGDMGYKIPPLFTRKDITKLKLLSKFVIKQNMADYVAYYYRKR